MTDDIYIVICRDYVGPRNKPYVLATRQTFATKADAQAYATTVSASRKPIVVAGRFHQLRYPS